jgi:hypothetical protein
LGRALSGDRVRHRDDQYQSERRISSIRLARGAGPTIQHEHTGLTNAINSTTIVHLARILRALMWFELLESRTEESSPTT